MRVLVFAFSLLLSLPTMADTYLMLYQAAGWPQQREHFSEALKVVQLRYRNSLPPVIYDALVANSNQRFEAQAIDQRALRALKNNLSNPEPALQFFQSPLGRKIVSAEVLASRSDQLARYAQGLPLINAEATRRLLVRHLAQTLPVKEASAEVSLALAGVAADSLSQMIPGLLGGEGAQAMLNAQRQRLISQMDNDIDNSLLHVYRELSDAELEEFVSFVQSEQGKAYYQAALAALSNGLAVGRSNSTLNTGE